MHFINKSHCVNYKHKEHCTSVAEGFHRVNMGFWCANWWTAWKESLSLWSCKGTKTGDKRTVHNVYMISTLFWYLQLRSGCIIHPLIDGLEGWYMNISIVSASSCRELTFAVEITNRLLERSPFTPSSLFIHANPSHTHTTYTHPAASCSVWCETHFRKGKEWPHLYVHSVCTVSSESVKTPVIVKLQLWQCWERKINEYDLWYACVVSALWYIYIKYFTTRYEISYWAYWVSCQWKSKETLLFFCRNAFHMSALSLGSHIFHFQAPTILSTSVASLPLEGLH